MGKHLRIAGIVQGVGYRASFDAQARALGVSGWVRNRCDGSVEALVHGDDADVQQLLAWARRGPTMARVDYVDVTDSDDTQVQANGFAIRPTE